MTLRSRMPSQQHAVVEFYDYTVCSIGSNLQNIPLCVISIKSFFVSAALRDRHSPRWQVLELRKRSRTNGRQQCVPLTFPRRFGTVECADRTFRVSVSRRRPVTRFVTVHHTFLRRPSPSAQRYPDTRQKCATYWTYFARLTHWRLSTFHASDRL